MKSLHPISLFREISKSPGVGSPGLPRPVDAGSLILAAVPVGFNLCFQATSLILVEPAEEKGSSISCPGMEPLEEPGFPFGSPQTSHGAPRWDQPGEQAAFCVGLAQGALVRGLAKHDGVIYCHPPCPKRGCGTW